MKKSILILISLLIIFTGCTTTNAQRLSQEALRFFDEGDVEAAIPLFEEALAAQKKNPEYRYNLLYAYYTNGKFNRVIEESEEAFALFPFHLEFLTLKAKAQIEEEQIASAIETYTRIIALNPGDTAFLYRLLEEAEAADLTEEIRFLSDAILRIEPQSIAAFRALSKLESDSYYTRILSYLTKEGPPPSQ